MRVNESPSKVRRRFGFWASAFCMITPTTPPSITLAFYPIFKEWLHICTRFIDIGEFSRQSAWCCYMTTYYDIPADLLIPALAEKLSTVKDIEQPDWSNYVKTGADRERPPTQSNWWNVRAASILRKVARQGPVGVTLWHKIMVAASTMVLDQIHQELHQDTSFEQPYNSWKRQVSSN